MERCASLGLTLSRVASRDATREELERVHTPQYLDALDQLRGHYTVLDPDTYVAPCSIDAATRAAGSAAALVEAVLAPDAQPQGTSMRLGAALLRPPGHHATRDAGMGFCILNNVAVAARTALRSGLSRVAVIDIDVHHGNGTEDVFWDDPRVLFCSLHQWPFYPGTGAAEHVGGGDGAGYTVNIPLSDGATDAVYEAAFDEIVLPILDEYAPELILVSAGFDAHERDPMASMKLSRAAYGAIARRLANAAAEKAAGRLIFVLEGGYDLFALENSLAAALLAAAGLPVPDEPTAPPSGPAPKGPISARHRADLERAHRSARRRWVTL